MKVSALKELTSYLFSLNHLHHPVTQARKLVISLSTRFQLLHPVPVSALIMWCLWSLISTHAPAWVHSVPQSFPPAPQWQPPPGRQGSDSLLSGPPFTRLQSDLPQPQIRTLQTLKTFLTAQQSSGPHLAASSPITAPYYSLGIPRKHPFPPRHLCCLYLEHLITSLIKRQLKMCPLSHHT